MTNEELDQSIAILRQSLEGNIGNRLTPEMATGLMNVFSARAAAMVQQPKPRKAAPGKPAPGATGLSTKRARPESKNNGQ